MRGQFGGRESVVHEGTVISGKTWFVFKRVNRTYEITELLGYRSAVLFPTAFGHSLCKAPHTS